MVVGLATGKALMGGRQQMISICILIDLHITGFCYIRAFLDIWSDHRIQEGNTCSVYHVIIYGKT